MKVRMGGSTWRRAPVVRAVDACVPPRVPPEPERPGGGRDQHSGRRRAAMERAFELARRGPEHDPNPRVGCVLAAPGARRAAFRLGWRHRPVDDDRGGVAPRCGHPARRGRGSRRRRRPRRGHPWCDRSRDPRALCAHRPHRPVLAGVARGGDRARRRRRRGPQPGRFGWRGRAACGWAQRDDRCARRAGPRAARLVAAPHRQGPTVRDPQDRDDARRSRGRARRVEPVDHLVGGPSARARAAGPGRRDRRRHGHRTARRPVADGPHRRRLARRPPARARRRRVPGGPRRRAAARARWRRSSRRARTTPPTCSGSSRPCPATGCGASSSRAAPRSLPRSCGRGSSTRCTPTSRPCCSVPGRSPSVTSASRPSPHAVRLEPVSVLPLGPDVLVVATPVREV